MYAPCSLIAGVRGHPLLQSLFIVALFAFAGIPVWKLTHPASAAAAELAPTNPAGMASGTASATLDIEADFAPAPLDFEVLNLDHTVLEGHGPAAQFKGSWTSALPKEGADLILRAHWPTATDPAGAPPPGQCAAKIVILLGDGRRVEKSFWTPAGTALEEVVTVPGARQQPAPAP